MAKSKEGKGSLDLAKLLGGQKATDISVPDTWLHTGSYILNAQISGSLLRGVPDDCITGFGGESTSGKTYLCLNIARAALEAGRKVIYFDSEGAIQRETLENFGCDTENFIRIRVNTIGQLRHRVMKFIEQQKELREKYDETDQYLLVIDSCSMLNSDRSINNALKGEEAKALMGAPNVEMGEFFGNVTLDLAELRIPTIVTFHTYTNLNSYGSPQKIKGGTAPKFASSIVLKFSLAQEKVEYKQDGKKVKEKIGIWVTSDMEKGRFTIYKKVRFNIRFVGGMNPFIGLENYVDWETCGIGRGTYVPKTRRVEVIDEKTGQPKMRAGAVVMKEEEIPGEFEFVPTDKGHDWAVKHLGRTIHTRELFTPEVFTQEVLERLDVKIQSIFKNKKVTNPFEALPDASYESAEDDE